MYRFKKLNARGASHIIALMLVIVISGIVGSYLLIKSHADSLTGSIATVNASGIEIANADGTNSHLLPGTAGANRDVAWNKAGTTLAFSKYSVSNNSNIYTIDANGLNLTQITNNVAPFGALHPSWSPDGTQLVYSQVDNSQPNNNNYGTIYVVAVDGKGAPAAISQGPKDSNPSWSPDGSKIVYLTDDNTASPGVPPKWTTVAPDGTNPTVLANTPVAYDAAWSPDSQSLVFVDDGSLGDDGHGSSTGVFTGCGVETYNIASQQSTNVFKYANFGCGGIPWESTVSWSPDGQSIAFTMFPWDPSSDSSAEGSPDSDVYTISYTGGSLHKLHLSGFSGVAWGTTPSPTYTATCTITNFPGTVASGTTFTPSVSITNTGTMPITPTLVPSVSLAKNTGTTLESVVTSEIPAGATITQALAPYKAVANTTTAGIYGIVSNPDNKAGQAYMNCTQTFTITVTPTYIASCTLSDVPTSVKRGGSFSPKVNLKNTGNRAFDITMQSLVNPNKGVAVNFKNFTAQNFKAGGTTSHVLGKYTVPKTSTATSGVVRSTDHDPKTGFTCSKSFTIKK